MAASIDPFTRKKEPFAVSRTVYPFPYSVRELGLRTQGLPAGHRSTTKRATSQDYSYYNHAEARMRACFNFECEQNSLPTSNCEASTLRIAANVY